MRLLLSLLWCLRYVEREADFCRCDPLIERQVRLKMQSGRFRSASLDSKTGPRNDRPAGQ